MSASYLARAEDDLSCPLCLELFVDPNTPKQLTCPHVYCQVCLEKMVEGGLHVVTCPECRTITRVPAKTPTGDGGIADLKTALRLRSLAENHRKHIEKQQASSTVGTGTKQSRVPLCPEHDDEKMHFYCVTCKVLVCQACVLLDHDKETHEIKGVKVVYKEKLAEMNNRVKEGKDNLKHNQDLVEAVKNHVMTVEEATVATEKSIDKAVREAVAKVQENGRNMKTKLKEMNQGQLLSYQNQKTKIENDMQALRNITAEAEITMENASPYEYLRKHDSLEERMKKIQADGKGGRIETTEGAKVFKMVPAPIGQLGELVPVREMNKIQNINLLNIHYSYISGTNGTLAVCHDMCVSIYHKQGTREYKHKLDLNVRGNDVAVTASSKILVATNDSVRVYKSSGQHERTFHTTKDRNTTVIALTSIASLPDDRIVVGDKGRQVLTVHTPGGELIMTIYVGFEPCSITALKDAQVALYQNAKVCVYDLNTGKEVLSADLLGVECVCYDEETGSLMAATYMYDGRNHEIKQYSVNPWRLIKQLGVVKGYPYSMVFADKDDLVVSVYTGKLYVYRCTG